MCLLTAVWPEAIQGRQNLGMKRIWAWVAATAGAAVLALGAVGLVLPGLEELSWAAGSGSFVLAAVAVVLAWPRHMPKAPIPARSTTHVDKPLNNNHGTVAQIDTLHGDLALDALTVAPTVPSAPGWVDTALPVDQADARELGVHAALPSAAGDELPPYVARDADTELERRLEAAAASPRGGLVLVTGASTAGKTRALVEALERTMPKRVLLAPPEDADLRPLPAWLGVRAAQAPRGWVVWLDDLDRHLGTSGLTSTLLSQLGRADAIVVATIRQKQLQLLRPASTDHGPQSGGYTVLKAPTVVIDRRWSPGERERAARSKDQRLVAAADNGRFGVAEQLAAGPVLQQAWQAGQDNGHVRGYAMVAVAVDLARVGLTTSLTREQIEQVHTTYLPIPPPIPEGSEQAWEWVTQVRSGVAALLVPTDHHGRRWRAFDYLTTEDPIPKTTWRMALESATDEDRYGIGIAAESEGEFDIAEEAWRTLAESGHTPAMNKLGLLQKDFGNFQEAERWLRDAAEAGDASAMYNLGTVLVMEDRVEEGEQRWRMAAEAGGTLAMIKLGWWLVTQGRLEGAEVWCRRSAEEGVPVALFNLGCLLAGSGRPEESEQWYRKAVEGSRDISSDDLLFLWVYALNRREMERRFRQAADEGDISAMFVTGNLLSLQGRTREAEEWWERGKKEL